MDSAGCRRLAAVGGARAPLSTASRRRRRAVENIDIARIFEQIADLLEIEGANVFRIRAYRTTARTIDALAVPSATLAARGTLDDWPGIGRDLASTIAAILDTVASIHCGSRELGRQIGAEFFREMAIADRCSPPEAFECRTP